MIDVSRRTKTPQSSVSSAALLGSLCVHVCLPGGSASGGISDEDWRAKYEQIKAKLPQYKTMKKELSELEAEAFVLNRTVEILQQQEDEMKGVVHKQEQKAGVQVRCLSCRETLVCAALASIQKQIPSSSMKMKGVVHKHEHKAGAQMGFSTLHPFLWE